MAVPTAPVAPDASAGDPAVPDKPREPVPGLPAQAAAGQQTAAPPATASAAIAANAPVDAAQAVPTAQQAPPASAPAPVLHADHRPGVRLAHAVETVRLTISAANAQGISRARIALRPAELGGIEIMLAHGPAGLSATLTADTAQAAQAMQRAADELQRTLASQGITLSSLQINVAGDGPAARKREDRDAPADDHGTGRRDPATDRETDDLTIARTLELPNGTLVDVLA
jgi:flagellar hook-length control protein FliK